MLNKKIEKQQRELERLMTSARDVSVEYGAQSEPINYNTHYTNAYFKHDVIFMVDSNLGKLDPDKMSEKYACVKFFCPTLDYILDLMDKAVIHQQPHLIFVHCGTNHLNKSNHKTDKLEDDYIRVLIKLRSSFPNAKIIFSSLLPRKEQYLNAPIQFINDFLYGVCNSDQKLSFMRNTNIGRQSLVDNKHVDNDAFLTLLSNIRYTLFGKIPRFINKRTRSKFTYKCTKSAAWLYYK